MLIPSPLRPGDMVAIVAPASPVPFESLCQGTTFLQQQGVQVRYGRHVCETKGYLAGTDSQRCDDINEMLNDPAVRGILFARGGYGTMRLLDFVDSHAIRKDPKLLLGMSDVTALLLSLYHRCHLVTFAGPMAAGQCGRGLDELSRSSFLAALFDPLESRSFLPEDYPYRVIRPGCARGVLLGGCLSLVVSLLGSHHSPTYNNAILFLEDVNEPLYRIDRMLVHLKLAGVFNVIKALILGHFLGPDGTDLALQVEELVTHLTQTNPVPILSQVPHGHTLPNLTLPHGAPVVLETDPVSLRVSLAQSSSSEPLANV